MPPRKKSKADPAEAFLNSVEALRMKHKLGAHSRDDTAEDGAPRYVDIMTFCDSPEYLNLPTNNLNLWVGQRVILKCFYMGSRGNEDIELTSEEWTWLYDRQLDKVIEKIKRQTDGCERGKHNFQFTELHLALGRRASKTIESN